MELKDVMDALKMWNDVNPFVRGMLWFLWFVSFEASASSGFIVFAFMSVLCVVMGVFEYLRINEKELLYA